MILAGPGAEKSVINLQSRCLDPGKYSTHLEKWLLFYRLVSSKINICIVWCEGGGEAGVFSGCMIEIFVKEK